MWFVRSASFGFALLSAGCIFGPEPKIEKHVTEGSYCASRVALDLPEARRIDTSTTPAEAATELGYTPRAIELARIIGALPTVEKIASATLHDSEDEETAKLRDQVNSRIFMASLDLASTLAHLTCEEGRATQTANALRSADTEQTTNLLAWSLVLGAVTAVASGVLAIMYIDPTPSAVVGIGGGVASGAAGFGPFLISRTTTFRHTRNILRDVWTGTDHPHFPEKVWAYLTTPAFSRSSHPTLRDYIVATWKESGVLGDDPAHPNPTKVELYFGEGGAYDANGLDGRVNMLRELREVVSLMNLNLKVLAMYVDRRTPPESPFTK